MLGRRSERQRRRDRPTAWTTWTADTSNAATQLNNVSFANSRYGFAVGNTGLIDAYTNIDTTPPNPFSLTAPSATADVSNGVTLSSSPTDDTSVASVAYAYCPGTTCSWGSATAIGSTTTGPPFTVTWTSQPANGTYSLIARATDPYGNHTDSSTTTVYVNNPTSSSGAAVSSLSWTHTVVAGSNSVLVVGVTSEHTTSSCQASTVTYGGTPLTQVSTALSSSASFECASLWYMLAPPVGTASVSVSFGSALNGASAGATTLFGIKQAAPDAFATGSSTSGAATTGLTTLAASSTVVDVFASGSALGNLAPAAGQTALWTQNDASTGQASGGSSSKAVASAGATTVTWTQTGINQSAQVAAAFAPPDTTPPNAFAIASPAAGASVANGQTISSSPTDPNSAVASVAYGYCPGSSCTFATSTAIGTATTGPPFSVTWTSQPANGTYTLIARATDPSGNYTDSSTTTVTVSNGSGMSWYGSGWLYRKAITIDHTKVAGNQTNFPVLINSVDGRGPRRERAGERQRHPLHRLRRRHEAQRRDRVVHLGHRGARGVGSGARASARPWTRRSTCTTAMRPPRASRTRRASGTRTTRACTTCRTGRRLSLADSTTNANTGTNAGATAGSGQIYGGAAFSGASQYFSTGVTGMPSVNGAMTISGWFYVPSSAGFALRDIAALYSSGSGTGDQFRITASGTLQVSEWGGTIAITGTKAITTNAWHYGVFTYSGTSASLYLDGALDTSATVAMQAGTASKFYVGSYGSGEYWNGSLDEVRVSNAVRSATWIQTEYNNQASPSTFYSLGTPQQVSWYNPSWTYRKAITINHTKVYGALTTFPVLVDLGSDANLAAHAQANGNDILFTSSDGVTKLNDEIESYNSSTGALVAWVQAPSLSTTADTTIYMYFGNASATNQQNATGTWDANYAGAYHLTNGTTLSLADSTTNARTGTNHSAGATAGDFDGGASFTSASSQYVALPSALLTGNNFTASLWFKTTSGGVLMSEQNQPIGSTPTSWDRCSTSTRRASCAAASTREALRPSSRPRASTTATGTTPSSSSTRAARARRSTSTAPSSGTFSGAPEGPFANVSVGSGYTASWTNGNGGTYYFNGTIDEVRISSSATARSAAWIQTEWANGSSPATFSTLGALQTYFAPCSSGALTLGAPRSSLSRPWRSTAPTRRRPRPSRSRRTTRREAARAGTSPAPRRR